MTKLDELLDILDRKQIRASREETEEGKVISWKSESGVPYELYFDFLGAPTYGIAGYAHIRRGPALGGRCADGGEAHYDARWLSPAPFRITAMEKWLGMTIFE